MAYTDYVPTTPDPSTQTVGQAFTSDRNNLLALRDAVLASAGYLPGWSCTAQNGDGSTPPVPADTPAQLLLAKGTERIKCALTWTDGAVTRIVVSYSSNSGGAYDVIKGGSANGYYDITYDASGNFLSAAWS